jgi:hypothetical protein
MSQGSYNVPTGGTLSMVVFAQDINAALDALATQSSGASTPANGPGGAPLEFQFWFDTTNVNFPVLKVFDGVHWVAIGTLDVANSGWFPQSVRVVTSPSTLIVGTNDQVIEVQAAVTAITLPVTKVGTVTIIDALGNFGTSNCTVTPGGGGSIVGLANDVLTINYMTRTYRQLSNGNYVIQ